MPKLVRSLIICLILFSAVSCRRAADEVKIEGGGPGNPDEIGALVVPPKAPPTEAELDREPSAPIVETLAAEDDKAKYQGHHPKLAGK